MVCPHFHIPLQSGDKNILKRMNRPYSPQFFKSLIEKVHKSLPEAAIGVDVMVGFPGETEDAFCNTLDLVESLPISYLHVFPYSRRKQTPAEKFPNQISPQVVKSRFDHLIRVGNGKKKHFYRRAIGQQLAVIVESKRDKSTGLLKGVSENYIKILFAGDDGLRNKLVQCQAIEVLDNGTMVAQYIA
jgi:threonylcarbamoyladenosine tRNA methylthiotransferase MtaB